MVYGQTEGRAARLVIVLNRAHCKHRACIMASLESGGPNPYVE